MLVTHSLRDMGRFLFLMISNLQPTGLSKYLVGDVFEISFESENGQFQLYTNIDKDKHAYQFRGVDGKFECKVPITTSGNFEWSIGYLETERNEWERLVVDGKLVGGEIQVDPDWISSAIVYNVFVRFFKGKVGGSGKISPGEGGTFDDVKYHLDDLKKLNINTLYFNPIHLIGELYRKHNMVDDLPGYLQPGSPYSIKDFKSIDPELTYDREGKKYLLSDPGKEFAELVQAAHERNMYVIMDLVFNHTAHDFVFQRIRPEWYFYKENITSVDDPYLYPEDIEKGKPWGDPKHTMAPYDHGIWWDDAAQLNWEFKSIPAPNQPPRNTSLNEMWDYFKSVPQYWSKHFGVDGFRCDIAYRVPPKFWKECISETRQLARKNKNTLANDVVFIAEAFTNDLDVLQECGFAAVYGDYSNKLAKPENLKGYLDYMYNLSDKHFPHGSRWFIFPECHDFGRTPQKVLGEAAGDDQQADLRANKSRWLLTAMLPGMPLLFNGFEKIEWEPVNLFSYGAVDWERDIDLRDYIGKVNKIRHDYVALQKGDYVFLETNQGLNELTQLFAFSRSWESQAIIVVVNMDVHQKAGPAKVFLSNELSDNTGLTDLITGKKYEVEGNELVVVLDPGESHIFLVNKG